MTLSPTAYIFGGLIKRMTEKIKRLSILEKVLIIWGLFWGFLGLSLFFTGLLGFFHRSLVLTLFLIAIMIIIYWTYKKRILEDFGEWFKKVLEIFKKDLLLTIFLIFFLAFLGLNLIAASAPELGFDALWYHLTQPKIWLMTHKIAFIPGGLLYYSVMPRLGEIFFSIGLAFESTGILSKIIHLLFGVGWAGGIYVFLRMFLSRKTSFLMAVVAYGTVWVSWLSQTAYIDLIVAFYVILSLLYFFKYLKSKDEFFLILSAFFMGFNLASKTYGLIIFATLILIQLFSLGWRRTLKFAGIALLLALPFYLQAYLATGNPLYPVLSIRDSASDTYLNGYHTLKDWYLYSWWRNLPKLAWRALILDFTPIFGLVFLLPFVKNWRRLIAPLIILVVFFFLWSLNPISEQRYFLVILPMLALISGFVIENIRWRVFSSIFIMAALVILSINIWKIFKDYEKTMPVVFGSQTKMEYLQQNLPLSFNFYDVDGNFNRQIKSDKVLTVNIHNLFYVNFNFWDWSFIKERESYLSSVSHLAEQLKKDGFDYVLLGNKLSLKDWTKLPQNQLEEHFELIYDKNDFRLYRIK